MLCTCAPDNSYMPSGLLFIELWTICLQGQPIHSPYKFYSMLLYADTCMIVYVIDKLHTTEVITRTQGVQ